MKTFIPELMLLALFSLEAVAATRYVDLNSPSPTPPYSRWLTAATNIQDAVDAAAIGDLVLVTNGLYQIGGRTVGTGLATNRVAVTNAIAVQSMNGALETVIAGHQVPGSTNGDSAIRCVYLASGASLMGFTLTNGATRTNFLSNDRAGGGAWCESTNAILQNCVMIGNASFEFGGGVNSGTLNDCLLVNNTVVLYAVAALRGAGGGAMSANLNNCVITGNQAGYGGGACNSILNGCLVSSNSAFLAGGGVYGNAGKAKISDSRIIGNVTAWFGGGINGGTAKNCLIISNTAGLGGGGASSGMSGDNCVIVGNSAPDGGGAYSCQLRNCIVYFNTGTNGTNYQFGAGNTGTINNSCTTPMLAGRDNFTNDPTFINLAEGDFRLDSNSPCINAGNNVYVSSATDFDGNPRIVGGVVDVGAYEFQSPVSALSYAWLQRYEFPTDGSADFTDADADGMNNYEEWRSDTIPTNSLSVLRMVNTSNSPTGVQVAWQSVATRSYWLERATYLGIASPFQTIATNIPGVAALKTFTDTNATNGGPYFYRVGVH